MKIEAALSHSSSPCAPHHAETRLCISLPFSISFIANIARKRPELNRDKAITEQTYYRWKKKYGGMGIEQLKELKRLQKENERLRRAGSELPLDKLIVKEVASGNF